MKHAGILICGGASSRMGSPKAWLRLQGDTLLSRAADTLGAEVSTLIVSTAPGQPLPPLKVSFHRIDDTIPGAGPLPALADSLRVAAQQGFPDAFVLAVDMPFVSRGLIAFLLSQLRPEDEAVIPHFDGFCQPLCAVYRTTAGAIARDLVHAGQRSLQAFLEAIPHRLLHPEDWAHLDPAGRCFRSINTPADYGAALAELGETLWLEGREFGK